MLTLTKEIITGKLIFLTLGEANSLKLNIIVAVIPGVLKRASFAVAVVSKFISLKDFKSLNFWTTDICLISEAYSSSKFEFKSFSLKCLAISSGIVVIVTLSLYYGCTLWKMISVKS